MSAFRLWKRGDMTETADRYARRLLAFTKWALRFAERFLARGVLHPGPGVGQTMIAQLHVSTGFSPSGWPLAGIHDISGRDSCASLVQVSIGKAALPKLAGADAVTRRRFSCRLGLACYRHAG